MAKGISIHIGLNHVDPSAYNGWDGALSGCINDATDMQRIADGLGYSSLLLLDSDATSSRVIQEIGMAADRLTTGDILLLTYSGHGGQVPDVNGDEVDGQDETWVLWDRQLIDDELYALWSHFAAGVRIFMLSDSCHSGTVLRMMAAYAQLVRDLKRTRGVPSGEVLGALTGLAGALKLQAPRGLERAAGVVPAGVPLADAPRVDLVRGMPPDVRDVVNKRRAVENATQQWLAGRQDRAEVSASVLLISGCQDDQVSMDGAGNGLFTEKLKQVWDSGRFEGDYRSFWQAIIALMPASQQPNFATTGAEDPAFEAQVPFTIGAGAAITPTTNRPMVRYGSTGADVRYLQQRLQQLGYSIVVDGIFGDGTQSQVIAFQRSRGLMADGVVGQMTWQALEERVQPPTTGVAPTPQPPAPTPQPPAPAGQRPTLHLGSKGPDVVYAQQRLQVMGYRLSADGDFNPRTEAAVRSFQSSNSLPPDGTVGPPTWAALG